MRGGGGDDFLRANKIHLRDVDDGGDDVRVNAVDVIRQDAAPVVQADAIASRGLERHPDPLLHQGQQAVVQPLTPAK